MRQYHIHRILDAKVSLKIVFDLTGHCLREQHGVSEGHFEPPPQLMALTALKKGEIAARKRADVRRKRAMFDFFSSFILKYTGSAVEEKSKWQRVQNVGVMRLNGFPLANDAGNHSLIVTQESTRDKMRRSQADLSLR